MEILNTYTQYANEGSATGSVLFFFTAIVLFIIFILFFTDMKRDTRTFVAICAIGCALVGWLLVKAYISPSNIETYHEVLITDADKLDVERYRIVEHKGKIIVIKDLKADTREDG